MSIGDRISSFRDLKTWQAAYDLGIMVYTLTKSFPGDEKFGITNQLRRAGVSISSNIAEGFSRGSSKDKTHFYLMAKGSLAEVESQVLIAHGIGYLTAADLSELEQQIKTTGVLLTALIKSAPSRSILNT